MNINKPRLRLYRNGLLAKWSERANCWAKIGHISNGVVYFDAALGLIWKWANEGALAVNE